MSASDTLMTPLKHRSGVYALRPLNGIESDLNRLVKQNWHFNVHRACNAFEIKSFLLIPYTRPFLFW